MILIDSLEDKSKELYADSAYDTEAIRSRLSSMGICANIPVNPRNGGKPIPYDANLYRKMRSAIERFFSFLKRFRRMIIRYERLAIMYKAMVILASIIIHLRMR